MGKWLEEDADGYDDDDYDDFDDFDDFDDDDDDVRHTKRHNSVTQSHCMIIVMIIT